MKIIEVAGPDTSIPFPINGDGGRERVIEWISKELGKIHDVTLIAQKGSKLENVKVKEVNHSQGLDPSDFFTAYQNMDISLECDILHIHHPKYLIFSKLIKSKKVVLTHHGLYKDQYQKPENTVETFVSSYLKSEMSDTGYVVYNPIPNKEYLLYEGEKEDYIFFIGACDKKVKRLDIAVEVASKLKKRLIVAGSASKELQEKLSNNPHVSYIGVAKQKQKIELFKKCAAVICPNDAPEAFCLVAAEANAVGTPVLSSNNGGLPEVIENYVGGFICNHINDYVLAYSKLNLLQSNNIRESCLQRFGITKICKDYSNLFKTII